jgi:LysR family transcriptional regulator, hydrogen peroxide-inducible genes activator
MNPAPHPFTLRQLQYAVAVAEELSFRRAAERCRVAQPSLSAQLAQLEGALGVVLFERSRRGVLVTQAGRDLIERARRLLLDATDLLEAGRRTSDPLAGTLRLGIIPTVAPYLLPAIAPRLRQSFAKLSLVWREDKTDALVRALDAGDLEAAIVALEAELGELEREVVGTDPFVLVAPRGHPLVRASAPVRAAELAGANVLLLDEGHCFREQALEVCATSSAHEAEFRATSLGTLVQMVAGGAGVTLLPRLAVATEVARARLRTRRLASSAAQRTLALVWRKRSPLAPALRELAAAIRPSLADRPRARRGR